MRLFSPTPLKLILRIGLGALLLLGHLGASTTSVRANEVGMLDVTDFGAVPDDQEDDTTALQAAINAGLARDMTVYFPPGIYLVSDTLEARVEGQGNCGGETAHACRLVGFTSDHPGAPRAVLRLQNDLPAFNNPTAAEGDDRLKPLLWIWLHAPAFTAGAKENCLFHSIVRDIDFELGSGNAFAVAVDFGAAQFSSVQNVSVNATGAFAGFVALPGRAMANVNLAVEGGRYGFYLNGRSIGAALFGIKLTNQTEAGIFNRVHRGFTVVGMDFATRSPGATAIVTKRGDIFQGHIVVVDARIRLPVGSTQAAITNPDACHVSLINTFVTGSERIVAGESMAPAQQLTTDSPAAWTRVLDYVFTPSHAGSAQGHDFAGKHVIDGITNPASPDGTLIVIKRTTVVTAPPPSDLVSRHVWEFTPAFTDPDVMILTPGGGDDTGLIQRALTTAADPASAHRKVLLTPGVYTISEPVLVPGGTVLMGVPGYKTIIQPSADFIRRYTSVKGATPRSWMIVTPNDALADPILMDLTVLPPPSGTNGLGVLHWQSGRGQVRGIKPSRGGYAESHRRLVQIDGNGGGRWYGYCDHFALSDNATLHPEFRKVYIGAGTGNPLTFYGLNLERGGQRSTRAQSAFCEIDGARNIRIFGAKTETDGLWCDIHNGSRNIQIASVHSIPTTDVDERHFIRIDPGTAPGGNVGIELHNLLNPYSAATIVEDHFTPAVPDATATRNDFIGLYRRGTFDPSPWEAAAAASR